MSCLDSSLWLLTVLPGASWQHHFLISKSLSPRSALKLWRKQWRTQSHKWWVIGKRKTMMILMMQSPSPRAAIRTKKRKRNQKKPSLSDLKKVAANLVKSLLSVIEKNGGVKDVIYDSENRRVAWSYLQVMYQKIYTLCCFNLFVDILYTYQ